MKIESHPGTALHLKEESEDVASMERKMSPMSKESATPLAQRITEETPSMALKAIMEHRNS